MKPLKTIVCGAGFWGKFWLKAVHSQPDMSLAAIVARPREAVEGVGKEYGLPPTALFTDLELAVKAVEADLVVVVTPPPCHGEHIQVALEAGKHVICEKPLADTWEAAKKIAAVVRSHPQQKFMVSQTRRFTDQVQTIHEMIAAGKNRTYITSRRADSVRFARKTCSGHGDAIGGSPDETEINTAERDKTGKNRGKRVQRVPTFLRGKYPDE